MGGMTMTEFLTALEPIEKFYFGCALFGGSMFVIQSILMLLGINGDDTHHGLADADVSFKFLSLQGLTAFFMMFGLVALTLSRQHQSPHAFSVFGGAVAGVFTTWVIGRIFVGMKRLQSNGTLSIDKAVGQEGSVYLTIHPGRSGQVQISFENRLRHLDAVSEGGDEIATGERVKVIRVINSNTLSVRKV
jgi:membrane protein implicated in regulation of membrane protease activity